MEIEYMRDSSVSYNRAVELPETKTESSERTEAEKEISAELAGTFNAEVEKPGQIADDMEQGNLAGNNTQIKKAVEEINKKAQNSEAVFGIHEPTNRVTIKIIDKDSREVLKEYPPEKTLDMIAKVWEVAGLLVDEKL